MIFREPETADDQHILNIDAREDELKLDDELEYDTRSEASSASSTVQKDKSKSPTPVKPATEIRSTVTTTAVPRQYDYLTKLNYLFRDARFFVIKSNNTENVQLSKSRGVWSTLPLNETKLNQAYNESRNVLLIFSVKESGKFQGFARLAGPSRRDVSPVPWVLPPGMSPKILSSVFQVDWVCRKDLPFSATAHLLNPWNDMKPVKIGRDGQEIEPKVAEELFRLFPEDEGIDMTPILRRSKQASRRAHLSSGKKRQKISPPRRSPLRSVPRGRYPRMPSMNGNARTDFSRFRRPEELAFLHGLPPLPPGPPGMYPPRDFDLHPLQPSLPRYYDGVPPLPAFLGSHEKRSYERSVDEFLWRTRTRERSRSRNRSRERMRDREYDRERAGRNNRDRDRSRGRDYRRSRSRSRGRERDRERRRYHR